MQPARLVKRQQLHRHLGRPAPDPFGVAPVAGVGLGHRAGGEPLASAGSRPPKVTCPRAPIRRASSSTWGTGGIPSTAEPFSGPLLNSHTGRSRSAPVWRLTNRRAWRCQWPVYRAAPMTTTS